MEGNVQTKLTLRLDRKAIQRAKRYVKRNRRSLSKIVADYFMALEGESVPEKRWSPLVRSLKGVLAQGRGGRAEYRHYLEKKHL